MNVTHGTPDNGTLSSLDGDWTLTRDAATGRFARRFTFALPTGGVADGIRWLPATAFTLSFPTHDYDARASGAPEGVTLANSGSDGVRLTFPAARTLQRVKIAGAEAADVIEARRVDGNVITRDAFAQATHGSNGATLQATDRQVVLRRTRGGLPVVLRTTTVAEVVVRSAAANVRVGVTMPALGGEVFYLGADAGAVLSRPTSASNLGPPLAALLQGVCDRLTASLGGGLLPASVPLTLVVESDTPGRARVAGFVLRYRLTRARFDDLASRRVFDFGGGSLVTREFTIDVPRGTALWSVALRMMGPFAESGGGADEQDAEGDSGQPPASPVVASDLGVEVSAGASVATRVMLEQAMLVRGAVVEVVALADDSAGHVRLHEDARGAPGPVLAEGTLAPLAAGVRRAARIDVEHAVVASAGAVWVAVHCGRGSLVWLTTAPGDSTAGSELLRQVSGEVVWTTVSAASGRSAVVSLVTPSGDGDAGTGTAFRGVRLYRAGTRLRGTQSSTGGDGDKETRFGIAAAIAPVVHASPAGPLVPVPLSLASTERGRVTVYPPEIEFDA